jgi:hypothetical protein
VRRPVVAIHQPNFLPWLGWFAKAAQADVLVLLDDVRLEPAGLTQRVKIKAREGPRHLTVPVRGRDDVRIDAAEIANDGRWHRHAARVLENAYGGTPGWERYAGPILDVLRDPPALLVDLNLALLRPLLDAFAIRTEIRRSSEMGPRAETGNLGNLAICRRVGAATYLSGQGAREYDDPAPFAAAGVDLVYSRFEHPVYPQPHGEFAPGLSALDLLFSAPDEAASLLRESIHEPDPA